MSTVIDDHDRFDELQLRLLTLITRDIVEKLKAHEADDDKVYALAGEMAFSLAAIIDGSRVMEHDGQPLKPVLTFAGLDDRLISAGGSWMHEYVQSTLDDVFAELDDE